MPSMILKNSDISSLRLEVPEGHMHLRATLTLNNGLEIVIQEAAIATIVRAYVSIKTHPVQKSVLMRGMELRAEDGLKQGYAQWQLMEVDNEGV